MGQDADQLRQEIEETRERMGDTADAIAYKADVPHRMQDKIKERVDQGKSAITGSIDQMRHQAQRAASRASDAMPDPSDVQEQAMTMMNAVRENPLGLFFGMAAVGFMIGSLMPVTQLENERIGPMVDELKDRAMDRMQGTIDAAREAAVTTISNAMNNSGADTESYT